MTVSLGSSNADEAGGSGYRGEKTPVPVKNASFIKEVYISLTFLLFRKRSTSTRQRNVFCPLLSADTGQSDLLGSDDDGKRKAGSDQH